jgi:hypothetical protein
MIISIYSKMNRTKQISKITVKSTNSTELKVKPKETMIETEERVVIENQNNNVTEQMNNEIKRILKTPIVTKKKYGAELRELFQAWLGTRFV